MKNLLIFSLFLAPTIGYRFELGAFSFSLAEPVILLVSAILLLQLLYKEPSNLAVAKKSIIYLVVIILWSFTISTVSANLFMSDLGFSLPSGLSDVRNWVIPVIGFVTLLLTIEKGWRKWTLLFLAQSIAYTFLGTYQHLTDSFRPFIAVGANAKQVIFSSGDIEFADFAVGFFVHPNDFAIYLFLGLMIGIGWVGAGRNYRSMKVLLLLPLLTVLYWTYAKTSLLVMVIAIGFFFIHLIIRSYNGFKIALVGSSIALFLAGWAIIYYAPSTIFNNLWWRVGLWDITIYVATQYPIIILFGNGMDVFAAHSYYPQPHSLYFSAFLFYGVFGVSWIVSLLFYINMYGLKLRREGLLHKEPILAALWIAILGFFVIGLVESTLSSIETRSIFLWILACFLGLARELKYAAEPMTVYNPYMIHAPIFSHKTIEAL